MKVDPEYLARLCRARDELADAGHPASIGDVARRAGVSRHHFTRVFAQVFGLSPQRYRTAARVRAAKRLLRHGDRPVTQVALAVGFRSLGSFSSLFAERVGCSPSEYRRRHRGRREPGCLDLMARLPPDAFRKFGEADAPAP